jgi:hypothetical protein
MQKEIETASKQKEADASKAMKASASSGGKKK